MRTAALLLLLVLPGCTGMFAGMTVGDIADDRAARRRAQPLSADAVQRLKPTDEVRVALVDGRQYVVSAAVLAGVADTLRFTRREWALRGDIATVHRTGTGRAMPRALAYGLLGLAADYLSSMARGCPLGVLCWVIDD